MQRSDSDFEGYSSDFEIEEAEDFQDNFEAVENQRSFEENWEEPVQENLEEAKVPLIQSNEPLATVIIPTNDEINVTMTFEPVSNLLNNLANKMKKSNKKPKIPDKPVTFHKKIKSSGYGANQKAPKKPKNLLAKQKQYPDSPPAPSLPDDSNTQKDFLLHSGPVFNISYSKDGSKLASCGGDSAAYIVKLPISKYKGNRTALVGHEYQVNSISWSSSNSSILTTSNNYACKMWGTTGPKPGECLLTIPGQVFDSKFYYVDKFISLISGSSLNLYKYKLRDPFLKDDVKRLQSKCTYKEVYQIKHSSAQGITRMACHNTFHSHIMLLAGTNKIVSVWDVDKSKELLLIGTVHRKPIHTLRFYMGSEFADVESEALNMFCCAAPDNFISLFDIRTGDQACVLSGHINTAMELGVAISPCKQYIASGSEDRSAYVWDLRMQRVLQRLKGFRDFTNDVAWNPASPGLCVAGNEGCVKFFL